MPKVWELLRKGSVRQLSLSDHTPNKPQRRVSWCASVDEMDRANHRRKSMEIRVDDILLDDDEEDDYSFFLDHLRQKREESARSSKSQSARLRDRMDVEIEPHRGDSSKERQNRKDKKEETRSLVRAIIIEDRDDSDSAWC